MSQAGTGVVELQQLGGRTVVTRAAASSPLKLLTPRSHGGCGWVFTSTYGGGLVGGDSIRLDVHASQNTRCLLSTQASTKVYRTTGPACTQELHVRADAGALVVVAPDPIVCFAGAKYEQRQRFDLAPTAGLVMIDWLTSGRHARGERWAFDHYLSRTQVCIDGRPVFDDAVLLDPSDGSLDAAARMGTCDCFATVVLVGEPLKLHARDLLAFVASQPATTAPLLFGASPIEGGGVVMRVAGRETEAVGRFIRERLAFVPGLVGQDPWARKW